MISVRSFVWATVLCASAASAHAQWIKQNVNTTSSFRGLSVVNEKIVWASGTGGTVIRTIDGGATWKIMTVPGADTLDFRDIEAFDGNTAYILSIGNGESSRIYKTNDGGKTWKEQFRNTNEKAFYDAMACRDSAHCVAVSDPVDGRFPIVVTYDGIVWEPFSGDALSAMPGEAAFAASGSCLIVFGKPDEASFLRDGAVFFVTGGTHARVLKGGKTPAWHVSSTAIQHGTPSQGIFSIAMFDRENGVIVGGNYEKPNEAKDSLAFTTDGGETWKLGTGLSGYRSGVTYIDKKTVIAVGTNGSDITRDGGKTWKKLGDENLNAVQAKGKRAVWAVGPKRMVAKMK